VRGVGEREYSTDTGYHGSFEIYGPAVSLGSDSGLRFLAFYDQAWLRDRGGESVSLSGAGIGVRAKLAPYIDLRIDQGWRLDEAGSTTHVGLRAEF
jgi:hemolysin activation/secretion protein